MDEKTNLEKQPNQDSEECKNSARRVSSEESFRHEERNQMDMSFPEQRSSPQNDNPKKTPFIDKFFTGIMSAIAWLVNAAQAISSNIQSAYLKQKAKADKVNKDSSISNNTGDGMNNDKQEQNMFMQNNPDVNKKVSKERRLFEEMISEKLLPVFYIMMQLFLIYLIYSHYNHIFRPKFNDIIIHLLIGIISTIALRVFFELIMVPFILLALVRDIRDILQNSERNKQ